MYKVVIQKMWNLIPGDNHDTVSDVFLEVTEVYSFEILLAIDTIV